MDDRQKDTQGHSAKESWVDSYRPCVGIMLINKDTKIFAGKRVNSERSHYYKQCWQMPQGGIDREETPQRAAIRELWEETGIRSTSVLILRESYKWYTYDLPRYMLNNILKGSFKGQRQKWFLMRFDGDEVRDINLKSHQIPEFDEWKWMSFDELLSNSIYFKKDIYKKVYNYFKPVIARHFG